MAELKHPTGWSAAAFVVVLSPEGQTIGVDLGREGYSCSVFGELDAELTTGDEPLAVVVDPELLGVEFDLAFSVLKERWPDAPVIVLGNARLDSAVAALRAGASDYYERTTQGPDLGDSLRRLLENRALQEGLSSPRPSRVDFPELAGESAAVERLRARIRQTASSEVTTMIFGETGAGKELVARLIHKNSARHNGPFIVVNCAAIPDSLSDSELFGHLKGSFSGAQATHLGLVRAADGGTLFLDDVGALSLEVQAKLLRALQQKSVRPVGASQEVPVDFRVLASSTIDLEELVQTGRFRQDLYYRLAVLEIQVPPLRERELDVLLLAERFLAEASARTGKDIRGISPAVARLFLSYAWPGNVRELRNGIDYAVAVARYDHLIESDLPPVIRARPASTEMAADDDVRWETIERRHIEAVLRSVNGNRAHAARLLGIDRKTLHRKLERLNIDVPSRQRSGSASSSEN